MLSILYILSSLLLLFPMERLHELIVWSSLLWYSGSGLVCYFAPHAGLAGRVAGRFPKQGRSWWSCLAALTPMILGSWSSFSHVFLWTTVCMVPMQPLQEEHSMLLHDGSKPSYFLPSTGDISKCSDPLPNSTHFLAQHWVDRWVTRPES